MNFQLGGTFVALMGNFHTKSFNFIKITLIFNTIEEFPQTFSGIFGIISRKNLRTQGNKFTNYKVSENLLNFYPKNTKIHLLQVNLQEVVR